GAEATVRALLRLPVARRPTAVFCANNRNTIGALRALRDHPRPVALVGFDDFELADMLATPVTVVRHAPEDMGRIAAELAYARLEGDGGPPQRRTDPREPRPRRSAGRSGASASPAARGSWRHEAGRPAAERHPALLPRRPGDRRAARRR